MNKQFFIGAAVAVSLVVAGLVAYGATLDDQSESIQRQNEDAEITGGFGSGSDGETEVFKVRVGDCLADDIGGDILEAATVEVVDCRSAKARSMVMSLFVVDQKRGAYPGEAYFDEQATAYCDEATTNTLIPTTESWDMGDRSVTCIEEL